MDLKFLLILQDFRNGAGDCLAEFLNKMTFLGDLYTTIAVVAIIYWCVSKKLGVFLMLGWSGNRLLNGFLKATFCVYRPWIRDPRIIPYGDAMSNATGYSFPSGHATNAGTLFGGGAVRKDFPIILRVALIVVVALVGFSRMYLGVHTPQDVLFGAGQSLLVMWLTFKLIQWLEVNPQKDWLVASVGIALAVALAVYAALKSYPADYDAEGRLIVDGKKMVDDTFRCVGWILGFFVGWILERRFVRFTTDVPLMTKLTRCVVGMLGLYVVTLILMPWIKVTLSGPVGAVLSCFVQMLYVTFIFPWTLKLLERRESTQLFIG